MIQYIKNKLISLEIASEPEIIGCSESEIQQLENKFQIHLPKIYREFLSVMGKKAGKFMRGELFFYQHLFNIRDDPTDLEHIADSDFIFYDAGGDLWFFPTIPSIDDPPVYLLKNELTDNNDRFSHFLISHIQLLENRIRFTKILFHKEFLLDDFAQKLRIIPSSIYNHFASLSFSKYCSIYLNESQQPNLLISNKYYNQDQLTSISMLNQSDFMILEENPVKNVINSKKEMIQFSGDPQIIETYILEKNSIEVLILFDINSKIQLHSGFLKKLINLHHLILKMVYFGDWFNDIPYLKNLTQLELSFNGNFPYVPISMNKGNNLKLLSLNRYLDPTLPFTFSNLNKLHILKIYDNQITKLPNNMKDLEQLEYIYAKKNQIFELPNQFQYLTQIKRISFSRNKLTFIPDSMMTCKTLIELAFDENKIPNLPEDWSQLQNLKWLDLHNNQIKDIPASMGQLKNLEYLSLADNQIEEIPDSFKNLTNLRYLDLGMNKLKHIPAWLKELPKLEYYNTLGNDCPDEGFFEKPHVED